jgi:hypothetical protein
MRKRAAEIIREYGPFEGVSDVAGVTYDGQNVWFAAGDTIRAFDPQSGEQVRALDLAATPARRSTAGTSSRSPRTAFRRSIRRRARARDDPGPGGGADSGSPGPKDRSGSASTARGRSTRSIRIRARSSARSSPTVRHRRHLGGRRAVARHLGRGRERAAAHRPELRRRPRDARASERRQRLGAGVRRRRPFSTAAEAAPQRSAPSAAPNSVRHRYSTGGSGRGSSSPMIPARSRRARAGLGGDPLRRLGVHLLRERLEPRDGVRVAASKSTRRRAERCQQPLDTLDGRFSVLTSSRRSVIACAGRFSSTEAHPVHGSRPVAPSSAKR